MDRTSALKVIVDESLLARVPGYVLGLIAVPVVDVAAAAAEADDLLTAAEDAVHGLSLGKAEVSALPSIAAWRDAYRSVDVNPNRFPCAAESVLRRVAKGDRLPRINALVNLCNAVSLDSRLPVASCDVGDITGELAVRLAHGGETYLPLGAPDAPEHPEPGEVVYADAQDRAHSRRWNWRQSEVIRTDVGRRRLLLTVEAVHEGGRADVERALDRLAAALDALGAVRQRPVVLDAAGPWAELFAPERDAPESDGPKQDAPEQDASERSVPEQSAAEPTAGPSVVAG
ncbi:B3/4 domain-containing protein [Kitasatospora purpeofusca]|uniref:B3/B4 domain-containing protein n=1 Tax=Kitasatospora purpeofusca TaxID=67352 RepID=UPI002A59898D|nr:phenylalanine--tRNA ligase beta subunit-related protein [Kitasatospora purpeofusca]MDY0811670.1 phenylalanine--tRNA ligase beta subunit-related protein [Kitasatospora purpeofusca]